MSQIADAKGWAGVAEIIGPLGVLVVLVVAVVVWLVITKRNGNGREARYQELLGRLDGLRPILDGAGEEDPARYLVLVAKMDGLAKEVGEIKLDVRDLRGSVVRHLEGHANP